MSHISTHDIRHITKHLMTFLYGDTKGLSNKRCIQRHNRLMSSIHGANSTLYRLKLTN